MRKFDYFPSFDTLLVTFLVTLFSANGIVGELPVAVSIMFLGVYWLLDFAMKSKRQWFYKWTLLVLMIGIVVIYPLLSQALIRHYIADPHSRIHDGAFQIEAASQFVLEGKNPYVESYDGTGMENYYSQDDDKRVVALEHYAYLPGTFLTAIPFDLAARQLIGWFDFRFVTLIFYFATIFAVRVLIKDSSDAIIATAVICLNPTLALFFIEGRSDILPIAWIILAIILAKKWHSIPSAVCVAIACTIRQFCWFLVPFYFLYVSGEGTLTKRIRRIAPAVIVFGVVFLAIILPWFLMSPEAFLDDTWGYISGSSATSWPVGYGFGFSSILISIGLPYDWVNGLPWSVFQLVLGLPVMGYFLYKQYDNNNLQIMLLGYVVTLFLVLFYARFFHENYIGFMVALLVVAYFMPDVDNTMTTDPAS